MLKITFYELLGMIRNGTQPQKVRISDINFCWDEIYDSYNTSEDGLSLISWMHYAMSDEKLATKECIEIEEEKNE